IICKKTSDEVQLFEGIHNTEMINICESCAKSEEIPLIKKPSLSQLKKADERYSVRERMERMSGMRDTTEISDDQIIAQGRLAKLRIPPKKQYHEDVIDNYYWTLNIARRRVKLSIKQLAEKMQVESQIIQNIEKGKLPNDFEEIFTKLEVFLGIKLLKNYKKKINFIRTYDEEQEILENVRRKMSHIPADTPEDEPMSEIQLKNKKAQLSKLSKGKIDFSRRENLSDITLNDLVDMKQKRERRKARAKEDAILGDDLDLEIDEL
ncbi:MAG: hypothetical protein ABIF18_03790, partial [archaeon]